MVSEGGEWSGHGLQVLVDPWVTREIRISSANLGNEWQCDDKKYSEANPTPNQSSGARGWPARLWSRLATSRVADGPIKMNPCSVHVRLE